MAVATSTAIIAGAAIAGAAGLGMAAMASKSQSKMGGQMQMPQAPAAPTLDSASDKAALRAEERRRAMARSKSVTSNPLGIQDEATVARKKLLGG